MSGGDDAIDRLAAACAGRLPPVPRTFEEDRHDCGTALAALIVAVRETSVRFAFDTDGRPAALAAVRGALPAVEAELFDAILDDVACELAAWQEALYRVIQAKWKMEK